MKTKDFLSGLVIGAGVGIALGIVLAPEKGNETLKKISDVLKDRFAEYKEKAQDVASKLKSKGENLLAEGQDMADEHIQDGEQKLNELKNNFNNMNA